MGQQKVWPESTEMVEVHERATTGTCEIALRVRGGRRHVHRHRGVQLASEIGRAREQVVTGQIVADQRHPSFDQSARRMGLDDRPLTVEDFIDAADEWTLVDVPSPCADRATD